MLVVSSDLLAFMLDVLEKSDTARFEGDRGFVGDDGRDIEP